jgi:tetratricopeptide (TPR) repeat protein
VSPTGIVYEPGTPPEASRFSQTAALYFSKRDYPRALELALEGVRTEPLNPIHFYLAGSAYSLLGRYAEADSMFDLAQSLYPAYELDVEPERESAWTAAFNAGVQAYDTGNVDGAIQAWRNATLIFDLRPEAHLNLARVLASEARYAEAVSVYEAALEGLGKVPATRRLEEEVLRRRAETRIGVEAQVAQLLVLEARYADAEPLTRRELERDPANVEVRSRLARILDLQGRAAEASEIYSALLTEQSLEPIQLLNLGVGLFHASKFHEASEAFRRLTEIQAESRDAWFNYANALFAAQEWEVLARVGGKLLELDPLGENAALIVAKAHLEGGDRDAALRGLQRSDAAPIHLDQLRLERSGGTVTVHAQVHPGAAAPGTPVLLRFEFYGEAGGAGWEAVTVPAPAAGSTSEFTVTHRSPAQWYRYEVRPPPAGREGP